ncbi:hypothetical protein JTE90_011389 [Oedothorax gibbosus]|uniref:Protein SSUH2 homolog n=1 Tax=Oedothorax gibbosus TaxID=931172 RepID=A0AAV6VN45_9ARAC|nr:hypothetical protein JTE90_011389 [Oedothorax gibbosus]
MMDELPPSYEEASEFPVCSAVPFENKGFEENEVAVCPAAPSENRFVVNEVAVCTAGPLENKGFVENEVAVCPAAPFENIGFEENEGFIKPPTAPPFEFQVHQRMPVVDLESLTADDLREACHEFVSESCCYGSKFVRQTELPEIINMCTYHYQLETFGEKRESIQRTEPFRGQPIDGPENGPPPEPWDVLVPIPEMFQNSQRKVEIPHTAHVRECGRCVGNCRVRCESCRGRGGRRCISCSGSGRGTSGSCTSCSGSGRRRCWTCSGTGQVKCGTCNGKGRLKHYRLLIVTW